MGGERQTKVERWSTNDDPDVIGGKAGKEREERAKGLKTRKSGVRSTINVNLKK